MRANLSQVLSALPNAAVGSFNILDLDMVFSVIETAESLNLPTIVGIASRHFDVIHAPRLIPSIQQALENAKVPVALHLDHAGPHQIEMIKRALDLGFSSIMIDGSHLSFNENVDITASVVELSRNYDAGVEGEIGGIAGEEGVADTASDAPEALPYTNAAEAQQFVQATGIHALAIAVGTAHGIYSAAPQISFETIKECYASAGVPLVMHGATGVDDIDMQQAVTCGIRKINYFSGLLKDAMDTARIYGAQSGNDFVKFKHDMQLRWKHTLTGQMRLYALHNSAGSAVANG